MNYMKKKIIINNDLEYKKLLKKLIIYKSIFYKNVKFDIKNGYNNENILYIMTALNIKNRTKRIEYIYDKCCLIIDNNNNNKNICGFFNGKCYVQRKLKSNKCNGCCNKCLYQTTNGCASKNLACKIFNCSEVKKRTKTLSYTDLPLLKLLSVKNKFIVKSDYFSTREDVLNDLYSYSFLYSTLRIILRLYKNYIRQRRKIK